MSTNIVNRSPFIRTTREIPEELHQLSVEVNKAYVDIAQALNLRTIGIFPTNNAAITGESWFLANQKQQTLREVFQFTGATLAINHNIKVANIFGFTRIYGTFLAGGNWFPLPYVDTVAVANQIGIVITPTQIQITGANAVGITRGFIILEWMSNV